MQGILLWWSHANLGAADARDVVVVVTRWFGGVLLGPQRFALINNTARMLLEAQQLTAHEWATAFTPQGACLTANYGTLSALGSAFQFKGFLVQKPKQ
eukprot:1150098-Pelagomonas_calceolata.AAC.1